LRTAFISSVAPGSAADEAGLLAGDELLTVSGRPVRDVIEYRWAADEAEVELEVRRGGIELTFEVSKDAGAPLGVEVDSPVFDEVRTCDNHCEFCFIYQLPPGMRRSLYLKDDDYRLSFLYGNFTTLTRFTEADLERVVTEGLSPLNVSIHTTDPELRAEMLRNRRGAMSLRWLRALLDHGVEVHGQVVVCPGRNDGEVLVETFTDVLETYPELTDLAVVPLGVSRFSSETAMRPHTRGEALAVLEAVEDAQAMFNEVLGHPMVHAADEYYLLADVPFPDAGVYGDFGMHEDGIGMARAFEMEFNGAVQEGIGVQPGFFGWVDGAPAQGYRAPRTTGESSTAVELGPRRDAPVGVLSGSLGSRVLAPLLGLFDRADVRIIEVENRYFGGNTGVTGLMVGEDVARTLEAQPSGHRYLLPDVCLSRGVFLDGMTPEDLPRSVEVIPTDGLSLRRALSGAGSFRYPESEMSDA
jgi:putative radical SAM enzyme (TIGR03279 family)